MTLLSFLAGILVGVAASRFALPLWRTATTLAGERLHGRRPYLMAAGLVAGFALAATIIYLTIGSRHSLQRTAASSGAAPAARAPTAGSDARPGAPAQSMQDAVAGLEARLARDGGSPADWSLLAQAYDFMGRPDDARRARAKAGTSTAGSGTAGAASAGPAVWQMSAGALSAAAAAAGKSGTGAAPAQAETGASAPPPTVSAAELERRVAANPRDAQAWLALADARRSGRDYAGASNAYRKAADLHAMSAQSWADYADALGSLAGGSLSGEAGRAIDNALAMDPANPKALWLKASQANEQHRYAEALTWWKKLRAVVPSDSPDARMVDANIAEATSLAGQATSPATAALPVAGTSASAASASAASAPAASAPATSAPAEVSGTVSLDQRFSARVQSDATLFIYAKAADSPGPPLAVVRTTVGAWPVNFRLDDSMAMIPSRRLSQFDRVVIEARISRSGQATPTAGDLYVTSPVLHPAPGTRLALVINREIG
jgi:cytochrome c-type biogenesis protein CcmH